MRQIVCVRRVFSHRHPRMHRHSDLVSRLLERFSKSTRFDGKSQTIRTTKWRPRKTWNGKFPCDNAIKCRKMSIFFSFSAVGRPERRHSRCHQSDDIDSDVNKVDSQKNMGDHSQRWCDDFNRSCHLWSAHTNGKTKRKMLAHTMYL